MTTKLLLDTCAIIWIAMGETISKASREALSEAAGSDGIVRVSPISAWELGLLAARSLLPAAQSPQDLFGEVAETAGVWVEALTPEILIQSSFLPGEIHRDPADRILLATARALDLTIVTRDRPILRYAEQGYVRALPC
jgi:PIN domain nuclease of toxin-antitoxin system